MQSSLQRRFFVAVGVPLLVGIGVSGYILTKFRAYEDSASHVMAGESRNVIQGHLVEARVNGAIELAQASVNSEEANMAFREKLQAIGDDIKNLSKVRPDRALDESRKELLALITAKSEPMEDLFVQYRNLKTATFNIYRMAWANKWMTIAHNVGLIINDFDNLPYHAGEKAASSVYSKISPLVGFITHAPIPQASKLQLFSMLGGLKTQVGQYTEALQRAEKLKGGRVEELKNVAAALKKYNEAQGKSMMQFGNEARTEVFKAILAFLLFILFALGWHLAVARAFAKHVSAVAGHIARQFAGWITNGGAFTTQGFTPPAKPDSELKEAYSAMDQAMRRVAAIRKEDALVKRLLNVPFVLVSRNKQAIFWNSALSILGKVRALEEMGPVTYTNLLRFTTAQGKVVDPVDKAFVENKEITQLALMQVGHEGLAVQATCTPVLGADHQTEYVVVHIRDLREENRRQEAELDRQLECVRTAIQFVKSGKVPPDAGPSLRKPVVEAIQLLKTHALELQEKSTVVAGHAETMRGRMTREAELKKTVHGRMAQVREEVASVRGHLGELRGKVESMTAQLGQIDARGRLLRTEYDEIRKRGGDLQRDLKATQGLLAACLQRLEETEEVSSRVRANERMIHSILEKSTVLNANNSILGSKRELTPTDVVTITENITQLMGQFERSYRFIEQSVSDVERGLADLSGKIRENLSQCARLTTDDHELVKTVQESEKLIKATSEDAAEFARDAAAVRATAQRVALEIKNVEAKMQRLVQIGEASLSLQNQLEVGFQGMFEQVTPPAAPGKTGVSN